jgi:hypothetical protein
MNFTNVTNSTNMDIRTNKQQYSPLIIIISILLPLIALLASCFSIICFIYRKTEKQISVVPSTQSDSRSMSNRNLKSKLESHYP